MGDDFIIGGFVAEATFLNFVVGDGLVRVVELGLSVASASMCWQLTMMDVAQENMKEQLLRQNVCRQSK